MTLIRNVLLLQLFVSFTSVGLAQAGSDHVACASNCVLAATDTKYSVSCIDAICKTCYVKQQADRKRHAAEEQQAMQRRAQEEVTRRKVMADLAVQQKKQLAAYVQQRKEREVVVVAPVVKTNNYSPPPAPDKKVDTKNLPGWVPVDDKASNRLGFKENSTDADWKIAPQFVSGRGLEKGYPSNFETGSNYAVVTISTSGRKQGPCGGENFLMNQAVIDRKGNTILTSGEGNAFIPVRGLPFVIKEVGVSVTYACSHEIYRTQDQQLMATVAPSFVNDKGYTILFRGLTLTPNNSYNVRESFISQLAEMYQDRKYDVAYVYYAKSIGWSDGKKNEGAWTAYLMSSSGAFKTIHGQGPIYLP